MRRLHVILLALLLLPQLGNAQVSFDPDEGCLNVLDITATKGLGKNGSNGFSSYYLHERFINEQFSVGLGAGYSYIGKYDFSAIPVFFSSHYFFMDQRVSPFVNLRAGIYWPVGAGSIKPGASLYVAPGAGLKVHLSSYIGILASVSYEGYRVRELDSVKSSPASGMASSISAGIGLCFQIPGW